MTFTRAADATARRTLTVLRDAHRSRHADDAAPLLDAGRDASA
ncbi:hypothetical protein [Actinoplanes sp. NPDC020271]